MLRYVMNNVNEHTMTQSRYSWKYGAAA